MEDRILVAVAVHKLLIEPVWNRNVCVVLGDNSEFLLLIEPVWNRNIDVFRNADIDINF